MVESKVKIEDDETVIAKAQEGDLYSFDLLVKKYQKKIYTLAYRMMKNHDAADDMAQETFINAYSSIRSFKLAFRNHKSLPFQIIYAQVHADSI